MGEANVDRKTLTIRELNSGFIIGLSRLGEGFYEEDEYAYVDVLDVVASVLSWLGYEGIDSVLDELEGVTRGLCGIFPLNRS